VSGEDKRVHVLVKPFAAGLSTNLVITTDRRSYHLQLNSTPATAMAALSWTYPADALIALRRQQAAAGGGCAGRAGPRGRAAATSTMSSPATSRPGGRCARSTTGGRPSSSFRSPRVGEAPPLFVIGATGARPSSSTTA
jgi:hypothetical protein